MTGRTYIYVRWLEIQNQNNSVATSRHVSTCHFRKERQGMQASVVCMLYHAAYEQQADTWHGAFVQSAKGLSLKYNYYSIFKYRLEQQPYRRLQNLILLLIWHMAIVLGLVQWFINWGGASQELAEIFLHVTLLVYRKGICNNIYITNYICVLSKYIPW